jgi:hypothetical protein
MWRVVLPWSRMRTSPFLLSLIAPMPVAALTGKTLGWALTFRGVLERTARRVMHAPPERSRSVEFRRSNRDPHVVWSDDASASRLLEGARLSLMVGPGADRPHDEPEVPIE